MRSLLQWADQVPDVDGKTQVVWDLCYRPDGSMLVAAVGRQLVVYDANDGRILKTRNGAPARARARDRARSCARSLACLRAGELTAPRQPTSLAQLTPRTCTRSRAAATVGLSLRAAQTRP
jgi:hypothetical protein